MRPSRLLVPGFAVASFAVLGEYIGRNAPNRFTPVVRCSQGHLYRSVWIPGGSLKAVRMVQGPPAVVSGRASLELDPTGRREPDLAK